MTQTKDLKSEYELRINRVIDHVRGHLDSDLSLDRLAEIANFSPFHFHRVFRTVTGETLAAFTTRARLERGAYLMKAKPKRSLTSIALEVGFASPSELSRSFRRQFGIAPSAWDRKTHLHEASRQHLDAHPTPPAPSSPLEARIVEYPPARMVYIRTATFFIGTALHDGYEELTGYLSENQVDWRRCQLLALSWDNYETTPLDQVRCDLGFVVPGTFQPESPFGVHEFPATRAVQVHCQGGLPLIAQAWDFLYDEWFPQSGFEPGDMPAIKRFRRRPDELGWDVYDVDCSIAIRPASP